MKKNALLSVLSTFVTISFIFIFTNNSTAYGNTFSMPDSSNSDSNYHSYNIDKEENSMNEYNINNNNIAPSNNTTPNTVSKNYDDNSNTPEPVVSKTPTISKTKEIKKSKIKNKTNKITKIEFTKHFIKLPVGKTTSISFTTIPANASASKLIYKSLNNSVVTFNNKKVTGIKKGFSTIIIMLHNGTVKAACPVKIMWI